jgi:hypothetical protein
MDVTVVGVLARPFEHDRDPATFSNQRAFQIAITQGDVVIDAIRIRPEHGGLGRDDDLIRAILEALDRDVRDWPRCCVDFLRGTNCAPWPSGPVPRASFAVSDKPRSRHAPAARADLPVDRAVPPVVALHDVLTLRRPSAPLRGVSGPVPPVDGQEGENRSAAHRHPEAEKPLRLTGRALEGLRPWCRRSTFRGRPPWPDRPRHAPCG